MTAEQARNQTDQFGEKKIQQSAKFMIKYIDKRIKESVKEATNSYTFTYNDAYNLVRGYSKGYDWIANEAIKKVLEHYKSLGFTVTEFDVTVNLFHINW